MYSHTHDGARNPGRRALAGAMGAAAAGLLLAPREAAASPAAAGSTAAAIAGLPVLAAGEDWQQVPSATPPAAADPVGSGCRPPLSGPLTAPVGDWPTPYPGITPVWLPGVTPRTAPSPYRPRCQPGRDRGRRTDCTPVHLRYEADAPAGDRTLAVAFCRQVPRRLREVGEPPRTRRT